MIVIIHQWLWCVMFVSAARIRADKIFLGQLLTNFVRVFFSIELCWPGHFKYYLVLTFTVSTCWSTRMRTVCCSLAVVGHKLVHILALPYPAENAFALSFKLNSFNFFCKSFRTFLTFQRFQVSANFYWPVKKHLFFRGSSVIWRIVVPAIEWSFRIGCGLYQQ